jgi:hypothetical protein
VPPAPTRPPLLAALAGVPVALLLVLVATLPGPGLSPDSCEYLSLAGSLREGRGFASAMLGGPDAPDHTPSLNRAPGYPALLAALSFTGLEGEGAARLLGALGAAATAALAGLLAAALEGAAAARDGREPSRRPVLAASLLCALWSPLLGPATWAWNDAPFAALYTLAVIALVRADAAEGATSRRWMAVAAAAAAAAPLLRFAGAALLLTFVARCLLRSRRREGGIDLFPLALAAVASLPAAAWVARNLLVHGTPIYAANPRPFVASALRLAADASAHLLAAPLPPPAFSPRLDAALPVPWRFPAALAVLAALVALRPALLSARRAGALAPPPGWRIVVAAAAVFLACSAGALVAFRGTFEARFAMPSGPSLLALACVLLAPALASGPAAPAGAGRLRLAAGAAAAWFGISAVAGTAVAATLGQGYATRALRRDPAARFLAACPARRFVSSAQEKVWSLARRPSKALPLAGDAAGLEALAARRDGTWCVLVPFGMGSPALAGADEVAAALLSRGWTEVAASPALRVLAPPGR